MPRKNKVVARTTHMKVAGLTAKGLTGILWSTLQGLKSGKLDPKVANSIAGQSREICRVAKLQLELDKSGAGTVGVLSH